MMGMRPFEDYFVEYQDFYNGVLKLARMEDRFLQKEATYEETIKYHQLKERILSQCPAGTNIEDLIGLVVVGELTKMKKLRRKHL